MNGKCAIYCRISREDEAEGPSGSIENQKSLLRDTAAKNGWEIFDIYVDENWSGADSGRPNFNRMLRDARAGRFDVLLCKSQSRFSRDMETVERYIHGEFPLWGVRFIAPADGADTDQRGNKKSRQINALVNQWYLEDLSENIRMVLDMKRREGRYIGAFALYGYEKCAERGALRVDEQAAPAVRLIFRLFSGGLSTREIARVLTAAAIPPPALYKAMKGERYVNGGGIRAGESSAAPAPARAGEEEAVPRSARWSGATVWRMLSNEMYAGVMIQGRKAKLSYKSSKIVSRPPERWFRAEGAMPAIITPEEFARTEELRRRRCPGTRG